VDFFEGASVERGIIAKQLDIQYIQLIGDSKIVIDWLNKKRNLQAINIEGWKGKIRKLI
jgi:hypothetical protein